jgi:aspartyl-tRNA(Asn)/glutamyl-tRNA(Gln) amidotransferase subunit C
MLSPEAVDHVAKLARLELTDAERDKMAVELSNILEHIEAIQTLDLEGVEPTSHVVDVVNALRPDVPHRSLDPEVALAAAPEPTPAGFGVPSPGASAE